MMMSSASNQSMRLVGSLQGIGQGCNAVQHNMQDVHFHQKPVLTLKHPMTVSKPNSRLNQEHSAVQYIVRVAGGQNGSQNLYPVDQGSIQQTRYEDSYTSNGSVQQIVYATSETDLSQVQSEYYEQPDIKIAADGVLVHSTGMQGQVFSQQGRPYIFSMEGQNRLLSTIPRASPATLQWLLDNYEAEQGVSLPRSTVYNHYLRHCHELKFEPMNPASFGKLIRSIFPELHTRRLGTRGNSKYHYDGVRMKTLSMLSDVNEKQFKKYVHNDVRKIKTNNSQEMMNSCSQSTGTHQHQQFLGDASAAIPNFGHIDVGSDVLPDGVTLECLAVFQSLYMENCEAILEIVVNLQFHLIETKWTSFWRTSDQQSSDMEDLERILPKDILYKLCMMPSVQNYTRESDYAFYQALVEVLIPDVLRPIPGSLTQVIRNFSKSLEISIRSATKNIPEPMVKTKLATVKAFSQMLRRYTSLNHLAQAARAVLQNPSQVKQMLTDLNRVDFVTIQDQATWVCNCSDSIIQELQQDMKRTLQKQNSLEEWAEWLEMVVNSKIPKLDPSVQGYADAAQSFLLKWSFYCSMVIRDLTLRSASSFGSFHLIRLLFDEYMFYLIEHKLAAVLNRLPIAIIAEKSLNGVFPNDSFSSNESHEGFVDRIKTEPLASTSATTQLSFIQNRPSLSSSSSAAAAAQSSSSSISSESLLFNPNTATPANGIDIVPNAGTSSNKTIVVIPTVKITNGSDVVMAKRIRIN